MNKIMSRLIFDIITCTKFEYDVVGLLVGIVVDVDAGIGFEVWMEVVALDVESNAVGMLAMLSLVLRWGWKP